MRQWPPVVTQVIGLFGDPVAGNPTSLMQNAAFDALGLDWRYIDFRVPVEGLSAAVEGARALRFAGLNVTIPHKVAVIPFLDRLSPSAERCGAVNTVVVDPSGALVGHNTDGRGFLEALKAAGIEANGTTAVILGAGGAARAITFELALAGASELRLMSRGRSQGAGLRDLLHARTSARVSLVEWDGTVEPPSGSLLVNCTPVGMDGVGIPAVRLEGLDRSTIVCDMNPEFAHSPFLAEARRLGFRTMNGVGMLARGGAANFRMWTGLDAPLDHMCRVLDEALTPLA